jgi:nucleoside-diphosphate-sugar epimerase
MKILVTGAAGFIGSHLVETLLHHGHHVLGIDNYNTFYAPAIKRHTAHTLLDKGCEITELDIADNDLTPYVEGVEAVYHCAAQPGISSVTTIEDYIHNNIQTTNNLLSVLETSVSLRLFVNIASSSIYGKMAIASEESIPEPISFYGITKHTAEQLVMARYHQKKFPATSFRLFSVYGARERPDKLYPRLIHSICDGAPFPIYEDSWNHKRSFTFVGDIVDALLIALETEACIGEVINIGATKSISTGEAIATVERIMNRRANYAPMPPRSGDQKETASVIDKAQKLLGYSPNTAFEIGILKEIEWFEKLPAELKTYYDPII